MSAEGHNETMKATKPGMAEYQAQAVMEYYFKKNGSEFVGYPSINASGENACILHYETNQRLMKDGDLLLSDCAAEYHGYSADVTRTIPVNGKFSPEQKSFMSSYWKHRILHFYCAKPAVLWAWYMLLQTERSHAVLKSWALFPQMPKQGVIFSTEPRIFSGWMCMMLGLLLWLKVPVLQWNQVFILLPAANATRNGGELA
jgi:hypothetical protein